MDLDLRKIFFGTHPAGKFTTITDVISSVLPNVYLLAGIILFLYLLFGGFTLATASGSPENADKGKKAITNAIMGFVIIFASYWITQIIQVLTGIPILNATSINP